MFSEMEEIDRGILGKQWLLFFENNYGASLVKGPYTSGGPEGLYELAVLRGTKEDYEIAHDSGITEDVIGYLDLEDVECLLEKIKGLN
jgi:hypothetical protein